MDIRNCKRCGKIYQYKGKLICDSCVEQDDEDFKTIREYMAHHTNATPLEISDRTKVEIKTITRFLREGRLEAEGIDVSDSGLECEKCGREILSGRFCEGCLKELQSGFEAAARQLNGAVEKRTQPRQNGGASVHTYDNILNKDKR